MQKFSIFLELFSNSNENERFPTLSEEELANLGSKNQNQNTSKTRVQNLAERKCSVAKRESWKIFLAVSYVDAILCRFLLKFEKKTVTNTNQIVERRMPECQEVIKLVRTLCLRISSINAVFPPCLFVCTCNVILTITVGFFRSGNKLIDDVVIFYYQRKLFNSSLPIGLRDGETPKIFCCID